VWPGRVRALEQDYYEILGIGRDASDAEIKKAYKRLAVQYHPDRNQGSKEAEEKFKDLAEAYSVLSDPRKRDLYNRFGKDGLQGAGFSPGFQSVDDIFSSFGSIFDDLFGFSFGGGRRSRSRRGPRRGPDLRYDMEIPFHEAVLGAERDIELAHAVRCETCNGTGAAPGTAKKACTTCHGSGQIVQRQGFFTLSTTCPTCHGAGEVIETPCGECHGSGKVEKMRTVTLTIPAGVDDGTRMRLSEEGEPGDLGGPPGDLYVFLHVQPDKRFVRDGVDLHTEAEIDFVQAVLGTEVEVPLIDGTRAVEVKRGTQPGETIVLRGEGVSHLRGHGKGDLVIHLSVNIPKKLKKDQEELLRQYAESAGLDVSGKRGLFGRKK
jgi:molecular chaperone DnaJ